VPSTARTRAVLATAQERFERTPVGEVLISILVVVVVGSAVLWSSPDSAIRREAAPVVEPLVLTAGLDQQWYMFAPDPPRGQEAVEVRTVAADGTERSWTFPTGGLVDQLTWYRWHKLKEQAVRNPDLRAGIARWAADRLLAEDDYPAEVSMVLTTSGLRPPGEHGGPLPGVTEVLHAEILPEPP
jgi:hypothetical protein